MEQTGKLRKHALVLLALLCLVLSVFAWRQEPQRNPHIEPALWHERDYWLQPVERNPHLRLPSVQVDLTSITVLDNGDLIALGNRGEVLRSTDQGAHWRALASNTREALRSMISLPDGRWLALEDLGEPALYLGRLVYSANQGSTWQVQENVPSANLIAVSSVASTKGIMLFAVGANGTVLRSTDQGRHWRKLPSGTSEDLHFVGAAGKGRIVATGNNGTLLVSDDSGETWQAQQTGSWATFSAMVSLPSGPILLGGDGGVILRSMDQGKTWLASSTAGKASIRAMLGLQNGNILAVGEAGTILLSTDQGATWQTKASYTKNVLRALVRLPKGEILAVGYGGTVLLSADWGQTWQPKTGSLDYWRANPLNLQNGRAISAGVAGYLRISTDNGQTWQARKAASSSASIRHFLKMADGKIFALDSDGLALSSNDQGETWRLISSSGPSDSSSVILLPNNHIFARAFIGKAGLSTDHGATWQTRATSPLGSNAMTSLPDGRIISVGYFDLVAVSLDEGKTWQGKDIANANTTRLNGIASTSKGRVLAVGTNGSVLLSADKGETWRSTASGSKETLRAVRGQANGRIVAAGDAGTLLLSADHGETWQSKTSNTKADLRAISHLDDGRIIVTAANDEMLFSDDQGETWQAITYRRYPARWYWATLVLLLLPAIWLLRRTPLALRADGLNELQASDAPELDPRQDRLGHQQIVQGVAAFMRNEDTRMPLTLAVTGAWGAGKSSLMGFLKADLAAQGFRCVWFNPWHYQKEEHILAALLEQVQQSAVPPFLSATGLRFRLSLLCKRIYQRRLKSALLFTLALAGLLALQTQGNSLRDALGYIVNGPPALKQQAQADANTAASSAPASLAALASAQASTTTSAAVHANTPTRSKDVSNNENNGVSASSSASKATPAAPLDLAERAAKVVISTFFGHNQDQEAAAHAFLASLLAALLTLLPALPLLLAGWHAMKAFSVKASILFTSIDGWLGVRRAKAQNSFRANFAAEFRQVTDALAPLRLAIFIDDLDRCKPEVVMEIMEAINFLSVSGDCFIVLGIAPDKVAHAIGLAQKEIASQLEPNLALDQARLKYGNMYLRKLVNIEIPVGSLNSDKVGNLLVQPEPPPPPPLPPAQAKRDQSMALALDGLQGLTRLLAHGGKASLLLALPVLLLLGVANLPPWQTPRPDLPNAPTTVTATAPEPVTEPAAPPTATPTPPPPEIKKEIEPPPREVYIRAEGDPRPPIASSLAPLLFLLLLAAVALRTWLHSLQQRIHDTSEFKLACQHWKQVMALLLDSSREVKRWQNRVRYINARLRLITPAAPYWQRAKLACQARRAQSWPLALLSSLISSLRLPAPVITQALPEAQLVALAALMSVANRFDCLPSLQQASSQSPSLHQLALALPSQLPIPNAQEADYQRVKLACEQAIAQSASSNQQTANAPIASAVLQQFFEIAQQFEIAEKPV